MIDSNDLRIGDKIQILAAPGLSDTEVEDLPIGTFQGLDYGDRICIKVHLDSGRVVAASAWALKGLVDSDDDITPIREQLLQRRVSEKTDRILDLTTNRDALIEALSIVNQRMIDEAQNRGWCDEFDEIIGELNERIGSTYKLDGCKNDFEVTITGHLMIPFSKTVVVEARDDYDAKRMVEDDVDSYLDDLNELMNDSMKWADVEVMGHHDLDIEVTG